MITNIKPLAGDLLDYGNPLSQGFVGLWPFNEDNSSDKIFDLSGNANHGTLTGSPVWSGEYINASGDVLGTLAKSNTLAKGTVVFIANNANGSVCGDTGVSTLQDYLWPREGFYLRFRDHLGTDCQFSPSSFTGVHHFAVSWDGTNARAYIDGILKDTKACAGSFVLAHLFDGYDGSSSFPFSGGLKTFSAYNRVLSASEIQKLYYEPFSMVGRRRRIIAPEDIAAPVGMTCPVISSKGIHSTVFGGQVIAA